MKIGFTHHKLNEIKYLSIPAFEDTKLVKHCFTTRIGGVSEGECQSLNLGFNRNDKRENVNSNFKIISDCIGVDYFDLVFSNQVHDDKIRVVSADDKGKGITRESDIIGVDALITNMPGVPLVTFYADCVPLYFLDPVKKVIGLAHSGWKSTVKKIGMKTIQMMVSEYGCRSEDILAAIGPSIGQCHFEVDQPVIAEFRNAFGIDADLLIIGKENGKYNIDLWAANLILFRQAGIQDHNITLAKECTYCNKDTYFSHRADHGKTGSLAAIMQLI